jgi:hypothetical protein
VNSTLGACDVDGDHFTPEIMIRTVDTDVVVLALACFHCLHMTELWIAFRTSNNLRCIPIHLLVTSLSPDRCFALPFFHAFTGCDTVSCFTGQGKKTA